MRSAECGMGNGEWGMGVRGYGLRKAARRNVEMLQRRNVRKPKRGHGGVASWVLGSESSRMDDSRGLNPDKSGQGPARRDRVRGSFDEIPRSLAVAARMSIPHSAFRNGFPLSDPPSAGPVYVTADPRVGRGVSW